MSTVYSTIYGNVTIKFNTETAFTSGGGIMAVPHRNGTDATTTIELLVTACTVNTQYDGLYAYASQQVVPLPTLSGVEIFMQATPPSARQEQLVDRAAAFLAATPEVRKDALQQLEGKGSYNDFLLFVAYPDCAEHLYGVLPFFTSYFTQSSASVAAINTITTGTSTSAPPPPIKLRVQLDLLGVRMLFEVSKVFSLAPDSHAFYERYERRWITPPPLTVQVALRVYLGLTLGACDLSTIIALQDDIFGAPEWVTDSMTITSDAEGAAAHERQESQESQESLEEAPFDEYGE